MSHPFRSLPLLFILSLALGAPSLAFAKEKKAEPEKEAAAEDVSLDEGSEKKDEPAEGDSAEAAEDKPAEEGAKEASDQGEDEASEASSGGSEDGSPVEKKGKSYYFAGLRGRAVVIPSFIIEAFGDGGKTVLGPSIGPEFTIRRDGFEYDFAITYTAYPMDRTPFKAPSNPPEAMELVESHIKVLYFTADFLWGKEFSPQVSLLYGGSAGLGFVWGALYRAQAYRGPNGAWTLCNGPSNPDPNYCAPDPKHGDKQHFGDYQEPSWADGGNKPIIMPWLALQMGLRFKPHRRFVGRLDFGIGIGQVFFGLGADYGL